MIVTDTPKTLAGLLAPRSGVALTENTLLTLLSIVIDDLELNEQFPYLQGEEGVLDFFKLSLNEQDFIKCSSELKNVIRYTYQKLTMIEPAAERYFKCLAKFHRTRLKYNTILSNQPLPKAEAVIGKGLLHYGLNANPTIMKWLQWAKWIYDIDNRAAQEVGYLFEPIIAGALGGKTFGSRNSPVTRPGSDKKGRQIDCLKDKRVYEIKTRLTNAASGQGRWKEELSFVDDCVNNGYTPVLLVLFTAPEDQTKKLEELTAKFRDCGGEAYIGEDAWDYMSASAGSSMSVFLEKYVKIPLLNLLGESEKNASLTITTDADGGIEIADAVNNMDLINRYVKQSERRKQEENGLAHAGRRD